MDPAAEAFAAAYQHYEAGRLADAEQLCRKIIQAHPGHLDALHILGLIAHRHGQPDVALRYFADVLKANPAAAAVYNSLGEIHRVAGRLDEAVTHYAKALELDPTLAEAHHNLALALRARGQFEEAISRCHEALRLKPALAAQAYNNLGGIYFSQRKIDDAIACFRDALRRNAGFTEARRNLALALRWKGQPLEALQLLFPSVASTPHSVSLRRALAEALEGLPLATAGDTERAVLASLLVDDNVSPMYLTHAVLGLIAASPATSALRRAVAAGNDPFSSAPVEAKSFTRDPLLLAALPRMAIQNPELELLLTAMRRSILIRELPEGKSNATVDMFSCALARQCFLTEYAFFVSETEVKALRAARAAAAKALGQTVINVCATEPVLLKVALYGSLSELGQSERLIGLPVTSWTSAFAPIVREHLFNRRRQKELAAHIQALTPIKDKVSSAVRKQYEDNPYPVWVSVHRPEPRSVEEFARSLRRSSKPPSFPRPVPILVAGCGTGHHPIQLAKSYTDCEILAVDLSRTSLAYGMRMAEQLGIANITFAQADILELASLGRTFSLIDCGGVLHHMRDPLEGWNVLVGLLQPGGLMKIALYSERARTSVHAAREFVRHNRFETTPDGIRKCRHAINQLPADDSVRNVTTFGDFFSLNGCRDLVMHVQEHVFTLPRIAEHLEKLGLEFLAMDCASGTLAQFDLMYPDRDSRANLALWDLFEQAHPETFKNMYQFWCSRK
jgi:tetratricopeptide (TPR) repeat protein/SAM-dependent methyltransferase